MNIKNKIINSNTFTIIKYGDGFKYIALATLLCLIVTFFDIKTISLIPGLINSISYKSNNNEAIYFIIFALISGITRILLSYFSTKINIKISSNISDKVIEFLLAKRPCAVNAVQLTIKRVPTPVIITFDITLQLV